MGYDSTMHIGEVANLFADEDRAYFSLIASLDLGCPGGKVLTQAYREDGQPVYLYAANGNDKISADRYDRGLVALDPETVIAALKADTRGKDKYRRYVVALALLESMQPLFKNLKVVFYGH